MSREPYEATQWPLTKGRTALVVVDGQNDFLDEQGWYGQQGVDVRHMRRTIEPTAELVQACRVAEVPVIWTLHGTKGVADAGPFFAMRPFLRDGGLRIGTWGYEVLPALQPDPDDWYVAKTRLSAFFQTNLEAILRGLNAETVLIAGVLTNQCVGATCKDAMFRDFLPVVVEDCTGTTLPHLHDPAIEMIRVGWGQVNSLEGTLAELREWTAAT